jgi:TM2 domain-containing membrane protein YozV
MKIIFTAIFIILLVKISVSQDHYSIDKNVLLVDSMLEEADETVLLLEEATPKHRKLKAAIFTLLLGPFGAHRLYLGTDFKVPLFYSLTLGGGLGIIPLIDFFHIIFSKDFEAYLNNPKFFMWINDTD